MKYADEPMIMSEDPDYLEMFKGQLSSFKPVD